MIERPPFPPGLAGDPREPRAARNRHTPPFANPWAECWGDHSGSAQAQMSAGAAAGASDGGASEPCDEPPGASDNNRCRILPIINQRGLHARASAKFVQTVERFDAEIRVSRCGETVGGLSIMGLMMLAAARGTTIAVEATGPQAIEALDALEALVADKFGEEV